MKYGSLLNSSAQLIPLYDDAHKGIMLSAYMFVCKDTALLDEAVALFIAYRIAKNGQSVQDVADRILRNGYVDVKVFPKEEKVKVDDVDELVADVYYTPVELDKKFYIINSANTASESAQNKLLKTLEESPSSTCIILKCESSSNVLPTIKSRCQQIELTPYPYEQLQEHLSRYYAQDDIFNFALSVSGGYPGIAVNVIEDKSKYATFQLVRETLLYMKTSKDMLHYSAKWLAQKSRIKELLDNVEMFMSDLVFLDAKEGLFIRLKGNVKDLLALKAMGYTGEVALKILPRIAESKKKIEFNASVISVIDATLYSILEVKAKCRK